MIGIPCLLICKRAPFPALKWWKTEVIGALLSLMAALAVSRSHICRSGSASGLRSGSLVSVGCLQSWPACVAAARRLAGKLVALHGRPLLKGYGSHPSLSHVFPTAPCLAQIDVINLAMPGARRAALKALAEAAAADPNLFRPFGTIEEAIVR